MAKVANPGVATLKNLAIFPIFGDFLLRSYINSLMIFENHPIFVDRERPPKSCSNIKGFILDFDGKSRRRGGGDRPPKICSNIKGFILHFDENVQQMADLHQNVI